MVFALLKGTSSKPIVQGIRASRTQGHDQLVFQLVKIQLVTVSVSDVSVSDEFS